MKAVQFEVGTFTYVMLKVLGRLNRRIFFGPLSGLRFREMPEPTLPGDDWVKIRTIYGGICGSDLNMVFLHDSPSASPFASMPFVVGHENMGVITEVGPAVKGFAVGDRVVADPVLSCTARGIAEPCEPCRRGDYSTCTNFNKGSVAPGMSIGLCQSTGGSWGEYFVAHRSQLVHVPDHVPDEYAALIDPLASALHPVMRHFPKDTDRVLVVGAGIIGLLVVACLRALGSKANITLMAALPAGVDWTPIWLKEISLVGVVYCSSEEYQGERVRTYDLGMRLMAEGKLDLEGLLTHTFPVSEYQKALLVASDKREYQSVKVAFKYQAG